MGSFAMACSATRFSGVSAVLTGVEASAGMAVEAAFRDAVWSGVPKLKNAATALKQRTAVPISSDLRMCHSPWVSV
jgi:hypothetical protein